MSSINLNQHSRSLADSLARLQPLSDAASGRISSGKRLDRPSSDVAGVGMAAKLDAQQSRLQGVKVNLQNGVSRMQSTAGQIDTIGKIATRMSEIGVLGNNSAQDATSRGLYQVEFGQLQDQLRQMIGGTTAQIGGTNDVVGTATFNKSQLFGPGPGEAFTIGTQADEKLTLPVMNFGAGALGSLIAQDSSGNYLLNLTSPGVGTTIQSALSQAATGLADVGAVQSRLETASLVATTASLNNEAALSVIRDSDIASDMTAVSRFQILNESHNAMLAQSRDASAKLITLLSKN